MSGVPKIYCKGESLGAGNKTDCQNLRWNLKSMLAWPTKGKTETSLMDGKYTPLKGDTPSCLDHVTWKPLSFCRFIIFLMKNCLYKKCIISNIELTHWQNEYILLEVTIASICCLMIPWRLVDCEHMSSSAHFFIPLTINGYVVIFISFWTVIKAECNWVTVNLTIVILLNFSPKLTKGNEILKFQNEIK